MVNKNKMARGNSRGRNGGREGRGKGRGKGHGRNYSGQEEGSNSTKVKGLCDALGPQVFNYSHKGAADQMRVTWEMVYHARIKFGTDMSNEFQNK